MGLTDSLEVYIALFTGQNATCAFGYPNGNWCYGNVGNKPKKTPMIFFRLIKKLK